MSSEKQILSTENIIKLMSGTLMLSGLYFAIKSDIRELATEKKYEVQQLQYQITELKECCKGKRSNDKQLVFNNREAILPQGLEDDNQTN